MNPQIQPIAHYRITAKLGEGGMGEVYRATDTKLGREVAIKVLPESLARDAGRMARFEREAQVLASLNHPNIAQIYGVEDRALVMELVEGESPKGPLPVDEALKIALQMAEALEYAHEKGIVHRDLKPANIKITPDETVKLLDFGLAKAFAIDPEAPAHRENSPTLTIGATQVGVILGTASYMSPEQAAAKPVDRRADIWSYGVVLWELLTGERLFDAETISHTLADVLRAPINFDELPKDTPRAIRALLERCLDRNVKSRLRDIGEARVAVQKYLANPGAEVNGSEAVPLTVGGALWRRLVPWGLAGILFVTAATLLTLWLATPIQPRLVSTFTIEPAPNTTYTNAYAATAVSPDGRYVVFAASSGSGVRLLWLRQLDSLEARPLPGTEGANLPFWSPDSKSIAFIADLKLKRLDLQGGAPLVLCDASESNVAPAGGAWNRNGVILIGGTAGLRRVPASSGEPVLVTKADASRRETGHGFPQFLPDGKRFLYLIQSGDPAVEGIYVTSLERPAERVQILKTDTKAVYTQPAMAGTGYLLWLREQTLFAQHFDSANLRLEGDPVAMAQNVAVNALHRAAFWPSDAGLLVYRAGPASYAHLEWFSRDGSQHEPLEFEGGGSLRLSPDAKRAVFTRNAGGRTLNLWLVEFSRSVVRRLTFGAYADSGPTWSPDGRQIAFSSDRAGDLQIFRKNADGAGQDEQLTSGPNNKRVTDWSRDGRFLLYSEDDPKTGTDLWALPLDGSRKPIPILQTLSAEDRGQFSPDGKWIAYESSESGLKEVYIRGFPPSSTRWQISNHGGMAPRWRGDGKELFYLSPDNKMMSVTVRTSADSIEWDKPRELFGGLNAIGTALTTPYDVSADGQRFLLSLLSVPYEGRGGIPPLTVVLNWQAALKK
jgi:Tol biopolymer transport system component